MIKIVLAEDHQLVRQGLKALLNAEAGFEVVAEASDGREAIDLTKELEPDVLVLDWMLPILSGLEVTRRVKAADVSTIIIVLSMHTDEGYIRTALKEGARGYVLKESSAANLVKAINECMQGRIYLGPPLSEDSLEQYELRIETGNLDPYQTLTDREREVLQLVAEGWTSQKIANELDISPRTVESHRASFMDKLKLDSTAEVTRYALRKGLMPLE